MKRRQIFSGMAIALLALCPLGPAFAAVNWDLYSFLGITHPDTVRLKAFSDEVKKRTNGELTITIRPAGELPFKANEVVRTVGEGQVQLGQAYSVFITGSMPLMGVTGLPMFLRRTDEIQKAMPIIEKYVQKDLDKAGVKMLFGYLFPAQCLFGSGKPIRSLEEFAGRKFRTGSPQQAEMLRRLGAASVALTTPEVPVALERGTVEGVITSAFNLVSSKWAEFTKWAYIADFHGADIYILVNTAAYNKLPPRVRQTLDEVAKEWGHKMTQANLASEQESLDTLRSKYRVEVFTAPKEQIDRVTDKMKDYWTAWAQQTGPDAVAMLREIRAAVGK